jgi:Putative polyhydroxyalkanoic acid system protein (PHA_gran_rgn)
MRRLLPLLALSLALSPPAAGAVKRVRVKSVRRPVPQATLVHAPPAKPALPAPVAPPEPPPTPADVGGDDPIALNVPHTFERAAARERITQLLQFWREAYGVVSEWQGDRVRMEGAVLGIGVHGLFQITDRSVVGLARNPGWMWRDRAQSYVEWMLRKYLHPTYAEPPRTW